MAGQNKNDLDQALNSLSQKIRDKDTTAVCNIAVQYLDALIRDNEQALDLVENRFSRDCGTPLRRKDIFALMDDPFKEHKPFVPVIDAQGRTASQAVGMLVLGNMMNALKKTSFRVKKGDVRFFSYQDYLTGADRRWKGERAIRQDIIMHDAVSGNLWAIKLIRKRFDRQTAEEIVACGGGLLRAGQTRSWGDIVLQARHALWRLGKITAREAALCSELLILGYHNDELVGCSKKEWSLFIDGLIDDDKNVLRDQMLKRSRYLAAGELAERGKHAEAGKAYAALDDFWNSQALRKQEEKLLNDNSVSPVQINKGQKLTFGGWKKDELPALSAHFEPIEWIVLRADEKEAVLITKDVIDVQPMADQETSGDSWQECRLRRWLNGVFCVKAFSPMERNAIIPVKGDWVSLPDKADAELLTGEDWKAKPTPWADSLDGNAEEWWCLPEGKVKEVCKGKTGNRVRLAAEAKAGVRPLIHADVQKLAVLMRIAGNN